MLVLSQNIIFMNIYWVLSQNLGFKSKRMNIYWGLGQNLGFKSKHNIYEHMYQIWVLYHYIGGLYGFTSYIVLLV